jgi:putative drug exporter of the RND superfamily
VDTAIAARLRKSPSRFTSVGSRAPIRTLLVVAVLGVFAAVYGIRAPDHLSSGGIEFYSRGTESFRTTEQLKSILGPTAFPNIEVILPVNRPYTSEVLASLQNAAIVVPRPFQSRNGRNTAFIGFLRNESQEGKAAVALAHTLHRFPGVAVGGSALIHQEFTSQAKHDLLAAELLALPLLLLLALLIFRSVVAAALPVVTGVLALSFALLGLRLIADVHSLSILSLDLVAGLTVGLSLDYSLLLISRYREELALGLRPADAVAKSLRTAGRTVTISSLTIAAAFASPLVFPIDFLRSLAVGGVLAALLAGGVSLLVLPAAFSLLGHRIDALGLGRRRPGTDVGRMTAQPGLWFRLARLVMARPLLIALLAAGVLLAMGSPLLGIRFTGLNFVSLPSSTSARQFDERIRAEFNEPLLDELIVVAHGSRQKITQVMMPRLKKLGDIAFGQTNQLGTELWTFNIKEIHPPFSSQSQRLVRKIRATPYKLAVTGTTANYLDTASTLRSHLPLAIAVLLATTLVILFFATDSLILPIKAVLMNALSLSAALGLLVLIFQDGRFQRLLDYRSLGAVVLTQPILLGAGTFGLSTDYGVFLLTRIKEARDAGLSNRDAVAQGLQNTGRVITSAALLFCVTVGALATAKTAFVKEASLGMVFAVALDATIVRVLLVPSLMVLLGRWNWWRPRWSRSARP